MKTLRIIISGLAVLTLTVSLWAKDKPAVAVMNFTNYGKSDIKYLTRALPESVSATLSDMDEIKVVERSQLGKVIDEIALGQTGLVNTRKVARAGKLTQADVLLLGSVSGSSSSITLVMKAVDTETGRVLSAKTVKGNSGDIFQKANQAALAMGAVLSGQGTGKISVSTTPSGADVYIDGNLIGKSPVVEYSVIVGEHKIKVSKQGYIEYDTEITVAKNANERINTILDEDKWQKVTFMGFGVSYLINTKSELDNAPYYYFIYGQKYSQLSISAEIGYSKVDHDQEMTLFGNKKVTQERFYNIFTLHGVMTYTLFPSWKYFSPYVGGLIGWTYIQDKRPNESEDDWLWEEGVEQLKDKNMLALGAIVGCKIMPYSKVSVFIDGRFYYHPQKLERDEYGQESFLGEIKVVNTEKFHLNYFTIGGGLTYHFD